VTLPVRFREKYGIAVVEKKCWEEYFRGMVQRERKFVLLTEYTYDNYIKEDETS
jgi:hypothetical protein